MCGHEWSSSFPCSSSLPFLLLIVLIIFPLFPTFSCPYFTSPYNSLDERNSTFVDATIRQSCVVCLNACALIIRLSSHVFAYASRTPRSRLTIYASPIRLSSHVFISSHTLRLRLTIYASLIRLYSRVFAYASRALRLRLTPRSHLPRAEWRLLQPLYPLEH